MKMEETSEVKLPDRNIADVHRLVEKIRTADLGSLRRLSRTLVGLDLPGMRPLMEGLLDDDNPDLSLAAYDWLARTPDQYAATILLNRLENKGSSDNERWLAAQALGRRGNPAALEPIRRVAGEYLSVTRNPRELFDRLVTTNLDDSAVRLLVHLAVAEADLGGDELAAIPVVLAHADANTGRQSIVRVEAVTALGSVATAGMIETLHNALLAEDIEVAERAVLPLQLIGAREAVDILVEAATPERLSLADPALTAIVAVTGSGPGVDRSIFDLAPTEIRLWWQTARHQFQLGICYRLGEPLNVVTLVELLRDPKERSSVARELHIITAFDFGYDDDLPAENQESVISTAERWLATAGADYRAGVLYKFGYERKLSQVLRAWDSP
jgi:hypothetical protein